MPKAAAACDQAGKIGKRARACDLWPRARPRPSRWRRGSPDSPGSALSALLLALAVGSTPIGWMGGK